MDTIWTWNTYIKNWVHFLNFWDFLVLVRKIYTYVEFCIQFSTLAIKTLQNSSNENWRYKDGFFFDGGQENVHQRVKEQHEWST